MNSAATNPDLRYVVEAVRRAPDTRDHLIAALQWKVDAGRYYVPEDDLVRALLANMPALRTMR